MKGIFQFTRPEATLGDKHYDRQQMMVNMTNFVEANETVNQATGETATWVKVWDPNSQSEKSFKAEETWDELVAKNKG